METNSIFSDKITKGQHVLLKIAEGLRPILVALHTLLQLNEMIPH